jgi:hypothetical protein
MGLAEKMVVELLQHGECPPENVEFPDMIAHSTIRCNNVEEKNGRIASFVLYCKLVKYGQTK